MSSDQQPISGDLVQLIKQLADDAEFWKHEAKSCDELQEIQCAETRRLFDEKEKYRNKYLKYKKLYKAAKKIAENNIVYYSVLPPEDYYNSDNGIDNEHLINE